MSIQALNWAYKQKVGNGGAKSILIALANYSDDSGFCYPSQEILSAMTEYDVRTIQRHIAYLQYKGFISTERLHSEKGQFGSNGYYLNLSNFQIDALKPDDNLTGRQNDVRQPDDKMTCAPDDNLSKTRRQFVHSPDDKMTCNTLKSKPLEREPKEKTNTYVEFPKTEITTERDPATEIFDYWKIKMNHPNSKLRDDRRRVVKARLKDGFTVDEIKLAIDGCKLSPHHQGANDRQTVYDDLELICRTASQIEKFIHFTEYQNKDLTLTTQFSQKQRIDHTTEREKRNQLIKQLVYGEQN